ncbi:ThuA domain-containing protein [Flavobacteriaceae bacterium TP-CH-4]|uniref:ThuA domain-containing protein n=2 Tax=Pelagihabitans pacificus TaxID=2696054 RepID=A0A967AWQ3_9FLAO|nr:ThuA domain-containing protein [Pelagihabitans pacificus]
MGDGTETDSILIFSKTEGFRHGSIDKAYSTLENLGKDHDFMLERTENAADFNDENLKKYAVIVFLSTTGNVLNEEQQTTFENYIRNGGNFMGIHSATDTEYDWPWYGQLVGAYFNGHPSIQDARIEVLTDNHPATAHLKDTWDRRDEWYNFRDIDPSLNVLLNLDEDSYDGGTNGDNHPIAWYHEFDGGRSFYTAGGHTEASYDEPDFQLHLLGGINYCLGR